jgi:hypothetical protein
METMAKMLTKNVPTSSLARLLDSSAAGAAIGPVAPIPSPREQHCATAEREEIPTTSGHGALEKSSRLPSPEEPTLKRELVLSPRADATFAALVEALRRTTGTKLTASHTFRALMRTLRPTVIAIAEAKMQATQLRLPSNAPGYEREREAFEEAVSQLLSSALSARERTQR